MITYIQVRMSANRRGRSNVNETMGEQRATSVISGRHHRHFPGPLLPRIVGSFNVEVLGTLCYCWRRHFPTGMVGVAAQGLASYLRAARTKYIVIAVPPRWPACHPATWLKACTLRGTVWVGLPACKCPLLSLPAHFISKLRDRYITPGW